MRLEPLSLKVLERGWYNGAKCSLISLFFLCHNGYMFCGCPGKEEKGRPLPKFGDWDVNDPASAEGFTVIFNKARDEKKTGGKPDSPTNVDPGFKHPTAPVKKSPAKKWFCCIQAPHAES